MNGRFQEKKRFIIENIDAMKLLTCGSMFALQRSSTDGGVGRLPPLATRFVRL